ncbi:MAG: HAMP domain-containing sensor histidine kinase [bacterium]
MSAVAGRGTRRRLFWRIYAQGLLLVAASAAAVFLVTSWLGPPAPWHGPPGALFERVLSLDLSSTLDEPRELREKVAELAEILGADVAVYRADGARLAAAGALPPGPLTEPWPPVDRSRWRRDRWVRTVPLGPWPGAAYARVAPNTRRLVLHAESLLGVLAVLTLLSFPLARALARPLEKLTATATALGRGNLAARTGLDRDDEVGALAKAFDDMAARIESYVLSEKELLAGVSHELRTPLARVRVALELAEEESADPSDVRARLAGIGQDLAELESILANVFAIARLDYASGAGALALGRGPVDPTALVADAAARFRAAHPEHSLVERVVEAPRALQGDATLLRRVLDNLLDNAAAYGETSAPIEIDVHPTSGGEMLEMEVRDRGVGVSEEDLARLFEPFFRGDRSRARSTGGVGLGLTLCRRIVAAHGGRITAERRAGGGLTMRVLLPLSRADGSAEQAALA